MSESKDLSFEVRHIGDGELMVKSGPVRSIIDFSHSILILTGPDLTFNKTILICHNTI